MFVAFLSLLLFYRFRHSGETDEKKKNEVELNASRCFSHFQSLFALEIHTFLPLLCEVFSIQLKTKRIFIIYLRFDYRILDSMKVPGQRSSFHICDILDLNSSDSKNTSSNNNTTNDTVTNDNNNNTHQTNSNESTGDANSPNTSFSSTLPSANSTPSITANGIVTSGHVSLPPPPPMAAYQFPPGFQSSLYTELGHHYHSMFPTSAAAAKSWLKEHEQYGEYSCSCFKNEHGGEKNTTNCQLTNV